MTQYVPDVEWLDVRDPYGHLLFKWSPDIGMIQLKPSRGGKKSGAIIYVEISTMNVTVAGGGAWRKAGGVGAGKTEKPIVISEFSKKGFYP